MTSSSCHRGPHVSKSRWSSTLEGYNTFLVVAVVAAPTGCGSSPTGSRAASDASCKRGDLRRG